MQILRENVTYLLLLWCMGLAVVTKADEEPSPLLTGDEDEDDPDSSRIIFEDNYDADTFLSEEIAELEAKQKAYEEELSLYEAELAAFSEKKTIHEAKKNVFETLNSNLIKKLKLYEDKAKENEVRFNAEWKDLEIDESQLAEKEGDLVNEEKEIKELEAQDSESEKELRDYVEKSVSMEAELKRLMKEYQGLKVNLVRNTTEEEERLKAFYGICEPVPQLFRRYLRVFDEKYTKMCYKPMSE